MNATLSVTCTAGLLIRGPLRQSVRAYGWARGYEVEITEDKGWLQSVMRIRVTTPADEGDRARRELNALLQRIKAAAG